MVEVGIRETRVEDSQEMSESHHWELAGEEIHHAIREYTPPDRSYHSRATHPLVDLVKCCITFCHHPWTEMAGISPAYPAPHLWFSLFWFPGGSATLTTPQQSRSRSQFRGHVSTAWRNQCGLWTDCCCFSVTKRTFKAGALGYGCGLWTALPGPNSHTLQKQEKWKKMSSSCNTVGWARVTHG